MLCGRILKLKEASRTKLHSAWGMGISCAQNSSPHFSCGQCGTWSWWNGEGRHVSALGNLLQHSRDVLFGSTWHISAADPRMRHPGSNVSVTSYYQLLFIVVELQWNCNIPSEGKPILQAALNYLTSRWMLEMFHQICLFWQAMNVCSVENMFLRVSGSWRANTSPLIHIY